MPRRYCLLTGLLIGILIAVSYATGGGRMGTYYEAGDLTWALRGAEIMIAGANPYRIADLVGGLPLHYPPLALLLIAPLTLLEDRVAAAIFVGVGTGLLAAALARRGAWWLLILASPSAWRAFDVAQWSPLIVALVLYPMPMVAALALCKPGLGLPALVAKGRWAALGIGMALFGLTLLILPTWPLDLAANMQVRPGHIQSPITLMPWPFALAVGAVLIGRWRDHRTHLLALLMLMPQALIFYDQLVVLALVPQRRRELAALLAAQWIAFAGWLAFAGEVLSTVDAGPWVVFGVYVPAVALVLMRPIPQPIDNH